MVTVRLKCAWDLCANRTPIYADGSKNPAFCEQYAGDGMVKNTRMNRCSRDACMTTPRFHIVGSTTPAVGKQHAEDCMVNMLYHDMSAHGSCAILPTFNYRGSKQLAFCEQHAVESMVNINNNHDRCLHGACVTCASSFNVKGGQRPAFCKKHAEVTSVAVISRTVYASDQTTVGVEGFRLSAFCEQRPGDGMIHFSPNRYTRDWCAKWPSFSFTGNEHPAFCVNHAEDDTVEFHRKHCSRALRVAGRALDATNGEAVTQLAREEFRYISTPPVAQEVQPFSGHIKAEFLLRFRPSWLNPRLLGAATAFICC